VRERATSEREGDGPLRENLYAGEHNGIKKCGVMGED